MNVTSPGHELRRFAEISFFGGTAVALHILLAAEWPSRGAESGGMGGEDAVTFQGATQQVETMVANWTRPPPVQQATATIDPTPQANPNLLPMSTVRLDDAPNSELKMAALPAPVLSDAPTPDTQTATPQPPEPEPEPEAQLEPTPDPTPTTDPLPKTRPKPRPDVKVAKTRQKASAGSQKQRSAGSGGAATAGNKGKAETNVAPGVRAKALAVWGAKIRSQVERRKRHPKGTRAGGTVGLRLSVARDGRLQSVSVVRSSGHAALDNAAAAAVQRAGRFKAAPKELSKAAYSFSLSMNFRG